jgi:hypothetical protein
MPPSIPDSMIASRISRMWHSMSVVSRVPPPSASKVTVLIVASSSVAPGAPSKSSVETSFSFGTISRYVPWNATSDPSFVVIT